MRHFEVPIEHGGPRRQFVSDGFELQRYPRESLHESIVNFAGHAVAFLHHGSVMDTTADDLGLPAHAMAEERNPSGTAQNRERHRTKGPRHSARRPPRRS